MSQEILYTSAPKGLKPGSRGFCTVVSTRGMPQPLADRLESLSGYRHAWPPHDPQASLNPINYSHLAITVGGNRCHVLSRIADCGEDYTQRSNKLAHHVALDESELTPGGPAWTLLSKKFCVTEWNQKTEILPKGRAPASDMRRKADYSAWEQVAGDAGWAGVLAQSAMENSKRPVSVIFAPGPNTLDLFEQALILVPPENRWEVTFSTYFPRLPAGIDCHWRFILDGPPEAKALRSNPRAGTVIDLINLSGPPPESDAVTAAQLNRQPVFQPAKAAPKASPQPAPRTPAPTPAPESADEFGEFVEEAIQEEAGTYGVLPPERSSQSEVPPPSGAPPRGTPPRTTDRDTRAGDSQKGLLIAAAVTVALLLTTVVAGGIWILRNPAGGEQLAQNEAGSEHDRESPHDDPATPGTPDHEPIPPDSPENLENPIRVPDLSHLPEQEIPGEGPESAGPPGEGGERRPGDGTGRRPGVQEPGQPGESPETGPDENPTRPGTRQKLIVAKGSEGWLNLGASSFGQIDSSGNVVEIGEFKVKPAECELTLLGAEFVAPGFELHIGERDEWEDGFRWPIKFRRDGQEELVRIGSLRSQNRIFQFEWSKEKGEKQTDALRKCLLVVTRQNRQETFRLGASRTFPAPQISLSSATAQGNRLPIEELPTGILKSKLNWGHWEFKPGAGSFRVELDGGNRPLGEDVQLIVRSEGKELATITATLEKKDESQLQVRLILRAPLYDFEDLFQLAQAGKGPELKTPSWSHKSPQALEKAIGGLNDRMRKPETAAKAAAAGAAAPGPGGSLNKLIPLGAKRNGKGEKGPPIPDPLAPDKP
ncbi:MAG: hypothetical protein H8E37_14020, partial [Planctomycetes bacterium]|nr:hypothetical protein [Planctomycetota bacterium]